MQITAVIITGNPKYIENNPKAITFYKVFKSFLEILGFSVILDEGKPHTSPPKVNLWIGHYRGVDRLRFPKEGVKTLTLGSSLEGAINHPLDNTTDIYEGLK